MSKRGDEKRGWNKRGQVTIFIIIGVIIIAAAVLVYSFYPQIKSGISTQEQNPPAYIQSCLENKIESTANELALQGGSITPDNYIDYKNQKIQYLCYTNEYYRSCIVQQAALQPFIESEIKNAISDDVKSCFASLQSTYEKKGYDVSLTPGDYGVQLLPQRITATFGYSITMTKGDNTQKYDSFVVSVNNNLYELTAIAMSIVEDETLYGDSDPQTYMTFYPELKVEMELSGSGEKVYILIDRNTGDKFQFAVRSQVWPAGYATSTVIS